MNSRRRMGIVPGEPREMRKYYQTSPQKCVTKVTQFLQRVKARTTPAHLGSSGAPGRAHIEGQTGGFL